MSATLWTPALVLVLGAGLVVGPSRQQTVPLAQPLPAVVPAEIAGFVGEDIEVSAEEQRVAGMSEYLMRVYRSHEMDALPAEWSLYVGYYESQTSGKTIHSPKNCLPGAGWEPLTSGLAVVPLAAGAVEVNRYLLQRGEHRALVLYWYQGRGRVEPNEYMVKFDLLRDAALSGRTEEALVRIIVPVTSSEEDALEFAVQRAADVIPKIDRALPA
jgi:EpsI family protein